MLYKSFLKTRFIDWEQNYTVCTNLGQHLHKVVYSEHTEHLSFRSRTLPKLYRKGWDLNNDLDIQSYLKVKYHIRLTSRTGRRSWAGEQSFFHRDEMNDLKKRRNTPSPTYNPYLMWISLMCACIVCIYTIEWIYYSQGLM